MARTVEACHLPLADPLMAARIEPDARWTDPVKELLDTLDAWRNDGVRVGRAGLPDVTAEQVLRRASGHATAEVWPTHLMNPL